MLNSSSNFHILITILYMKPNIKYVDTYIHLCIYRCIYVGICIFGMLLNHSYCSNMGLTDGGQLFRFSNKKKQILKNYLYPCIYTSEIITFSFM